MSHANRVAAQHRPRAVSGRFLTSPQRISHTRRMGRVVFESIDGEAVE